MEGAKGAGAMEEVSVVAMAEAMAAAVKVVATAVVATAVVEMKPVPMRR